MKVLHKGRPYIREAVERPIKLVTYEPEQLKILKIRVSESEKM